MTLAEKATVAAAVLVGVGVLVAIWQVLVVRASDRRRAQPVVVAHEDRGRMFAGSEGGWTVLAHVTNEGEGAAFNVRWGVSFFYWARYEDERRRTWETFNSGDRSKGLRIRKRVRFVRLREWREERLRQRFRKKGWEKERKIVAELSEMRDQHWGKV